MIAVVSFATVEFIAYGTAMDDGAGYERFYVYKIPEPSPCTEEAIAVELQKQDDQGRLVSHW